MKNSKKLIGLTVAILTVAGLAACGGAKNDGGSSKPASGSSKCSHKWVVDEAASVAATCTTEGKKVQKCSNCGETKETKVSKANHSYIEIDGGVEATCTEAGSKVKKCSVCGDTKTETVDALGHDYVDDADQSAAKQATCTEAGERIQHCTRCKGENKEEVAPLGHEYGETTWTKAATCTEPGEGTHECTRCKNVEAVTEDALGHDIQLVGDDTEPEAGKAKVRLYSCTHGCGTTYFGFKASEPSAESKEHLVIGEDGGAKFWGRPIGNAMVLDENGDASGSDAEKVYDATVSGDYFEYVFDLTAEQLAQMGSEQHLYCEASAANYLSGQDFWACDPSAEEWTPGYYIEGEKAGEAIADYRYILYVDDKPQVFDADMKAPVTGSATNQPKKEYVMPFTFKLHEGTNKIRLVMAGGYKSTFYNFTFRAVEVDPWRNPEADHSAEAWKATFVGLEHVKLYEYYNNDYKDDPTMQARESNVNYLWSRSKNGADNGAYAKYETELEGTKEKAIAQWNFRLICDAGYELVSCSPDVSNFKNMKQGDGIADGIPMDTFSCTQVKGDVTFTVTVQAIAA